MRTHLQDKLELWTLRLRTARKQLRQLRDKLRWATQRQQKLEARVAELEDLTQPRLVADHTYPAQMMLLAIYMVAQAGVSLRAAAKTVSFYSTMMGWEYGQPSHVTVLRWVLRAGLYQLQQSASKANRSGAHWLGILDESISLGGEKLLLLLGVKLPAGGVEALGALTHQDVEVLAMQVAPSWKAEQIAAFLNDAILTPDTATKLDYVVCDGGTNLGKALKQSKIARVGDLTHVLMNLVKKWYAVDQRLSDFCAAVGTLRRQNILGQYGYVVPATLRDKDRFLRIFNLVDWVDKIDAAWEGLDEQARQKLAFLTTHCELITELVQVRYVVSMTLKVFKRRGLSERSIKLWEWLVHRWLAKQSQLPPSISDLLDEIRCYLKDHELLRQQHGTLLCYSDIIESIFGRYKNKAGVKAISADVLKIPLYGVELTLDFVSEALLNVSYQEVYEWETKNTCPTRFGQIRAMRGAGQKPVKDAA